MGKSESSRIRTNMDIREQYDKKKNVHIVKYQCTQKESVPTLRLFTSSLIMFYFTYLMYH